LVEDVDVLGLTNVRVIIDQVEALRFVALVDRLYERQAVVRNSGVALTEVFSSEMLQGGYRKKYLRAISRLGSMTS
jgi:cell division protein ZapE